MLRKVIHFLGRQLGARLLVISLVWLPLSAAATDCKKFDLKPLAPGVSGASVDEVWAGTRVTYAALAAQKRRYFAYYDATRQLTIAEFDSATSRICYVKLDSFFGGWDSHNSIVLTMDDAGYLHLAGNMHASPLIYAKGERPGSIDGMHLSPMVGKNEDRTTYPWFLRAGDGGLLFLYRLGGSGDGKWIVNRYEAGKWHRLLDALFSNRWKNGHVSAYPSQFVRSPDGMFHVAIVWRRTPDVASNFAVSYAKTKDFKTWLTHDSKAIALPIAPENADAVEAPGEGAGLLNSAQVSLDPAGQPIITYTRYGEGGRNAILAARPSGAKWTITTLATADRQTRLIGKGSLPNVPRFRALQFSPNTNTASIDIGFSGSPIQQYSLSSETLQAIGPPVRISSVDPQAIFKLPVPEGLAAPQESVVEVKYVAKSRGEDQTASSAFEASLRYVTQGTNQDRRRECTPKAPKACAPPPSLLYYVEQSAHQ